MYHVNCKILFPPTTQPTRCSSCSKHHNSLRAILCRSKKGTKENRTHPSSRTNYAALDTPEKEDLHHLHMEVKNARQKLDLLREKTSQDAASASLNIDQELDQDIQLTIAENDYNVTQEHAEGTFQRVFWEQQKKAASLKDSRSMKQHPLFIKWCLYLRHISGKGYKMLRNSGCIHLPSQRTLLDYTHYTTTTIGFSVEVDE